MHYWHIKLVDVVGKICSQVKPEFPLSPINN